MFSSAAAGGIFLFCAGGANCCEVLRDLFYGAKERGDILHLRSREHSAGEKVLISARHRRRGVGLRLPELLRLRIALAPFFSGPSPNSFCSLLDGLACQNALVMGCLLPTAAAAAASPRSLRGNYVKMARAQVPLFGDH